MILFVFFMVFDSGFSFWNEDTVEEHKILKNKLYTNTEIQADNNLLDRISVFKMNSEQKLSFLGGLIDLKGYIVSSEVYFYLYQREVNSN